ncbi:hypothetical protein ACFWBN_05795 [Streptomyces sp. NPDC059989]|uniref:hypothetical protein n=1 Tax=Streptomyces sp. NPDC059989 TaxID=3347026 RepID=UPI00368865A1
MAAILGLWSLIGGTEQVVEHGCYCVAPWEAEYKYWVTARFRPVDPANDGICSGQAWDNDCYPSYYYMP